MNPKHRLPLIAVTFTSVLCVAVEVISLKSGYFIVFQNFFYIPIIIACSYYKKRGFAISVALSCSYLFLIIAFTSDPMIIRDTVIRAILFILIAAVITALSIARAHAEENLNNQVEFITTLLNTIPSPVFYKDTAGKYLGCNRAFETFYGKSREEIIGKSVYEMAPTEIACKYAEKDQELFDQPGSQTYEWKVRAINGSVREVIFNKATFTDSRENVAGLIGVILDITERKQAEEKLQESEERYRSLFENMLDGFAYCMMLYDDQEQPVDFVFLDVNKAFKRLTGLDNVVGKKVTEVITDIKELNPELLEIYGRVAFTGSPEKFEIDFKPLAKRLSVSVYSTKKGYFVAVFDDITEHRHYEEKLKYFAIHDQLTGLLNRNSLEDILNRTIARAKRGARSSLLFMDLDNFKDVNDSVGHSAGDEVLITLAGLLKDALRTEDIVFRLGGDEFAVLLDGMTSRESLPAVERLRVSVEAHRFELKGRIFPLSLSIGLIEIDGILATGELLSQADAAMYQAKAEGKNRVVVA